jgi:hypothetical protein
MNVENGSPAPFSGSVAVVIVVVVSIATARLNEW